MKMFALFQFSTTFNVTSRSELVVLAGEPLGRRSVMVRDCQGAVVSDAGLDLAAGTQRLTVPPSGLVLIEG